MRRKKQEEEEKDDDDDDEGEGEGASCRLLRESRKFQSSPFSSSLPATTRADIYTHRGLYNKFSLLSFIPPSEHSCDKRFHFAESGY